MNFKEYKFKRVSPDSKNKKNKNKDPKIKIFENRLLPQYLQLRKYYQRLQTNE